MSDTTPNKPDERPADLRIKKASPAVTAPVFTSTIVLAADGVDWTAAAVYVFAWARLFHGVAVTAITATTAEASHLSPIAAILPKTQEIGQMPDLETLEELSHFDPLVDQLISGSQLVVGLGPNAARYFFKCLRESLMPDDGSRPAVQVVVIADTTRPSVASATALMSQVDEMAKLLPIAGRTLLLASSKTHAAISDRQEFSELNNASATFKFRNCALPAPTGNLSISDGALASVTDEFFSRTGGFSSVHQACASTRWFIGWSKWVFNTTKALMNVEALPRFELPPFEFSYLNESRR